MKPIEMYEPRILIRDWGSETIVAETPDYLGKILVYMPGKAGGLQFHVEKDESFHLSEGWGYLDYDAGDGKLTRKVMTAGQTVHIPAGAVHRFEAGVRCVGFETSTPHYDDRVRVEERYGVPTIGDGPGLPTTWPKEASDE